MVTQGERQNYLWRPNDNSSTTRMRYDLEAEHWLKSFSNVNKNSQKNVPNFKGDFQALGIVLGLIFNVIFIILLSISKLFSWLLGLTRSNETPSTRVRRSVPLTHSELKNRMESGNMKVVNIYED